VERAVIPDELCVNGAETGTMPVSRWGWRCGQRSCGRLGHGFPNTGGGRGWTAVLLRGRSHTKPGSLLKDYVAIHLGAVG